MLKLGLEVFLEKEYKKYEGKRIGLVTNSTGVNQRLKSSVDLFYHHPKIDLTILFGPEHGLRGDKKEGQLVDSSVDDYTQLPIYSLYGEARKPSKEMMEQADVIVMDIQDIGSRYFTYIYTMAYVMEACAEHQKEMVILDRPNPISGIQMEGNLTENDVRSFVGLFPIPNRHGMTIGELAHLFKYEFKYDCNLTVIEMAGWQRHMYFDETGILFVPPSPNTTGQDMMILYTGTCLFEGTNISEGRGTTKPFEWIGAPFIEGHKLAEEFNRLLLPGVLARPVTFTPAYQKYEGKLCEGIQLHITDRNQFDSFYTGVKLIQLIAENYPNNFKFVQNENGKYFFDLLAGTKQLKKIITDTNKLNNFFIDAKQQLVEFEHCRQKYLLY